MHGGFVVCWCFRTYAVEASSVESIIHLSPERTFIGDITSAVTGRPNAVRRGRHRVLHGPDNRPRIVRPDARAVSGYLARLPVRSAAVPRCAATPERNVVGRLGGRTVFRLRRATAGSSGTCPATNVGFVPRDRTGHGRYLREIIARILRLRAPAHGSPSRARTRRQRGKPGDAFTSRIC